MHIAHASVPGSLHVNPGQPGKTNNQDALAHRTFPRGTVTVLCDGCGSQPHSGTGADIGAHAIADALVRMLASVTASRIDWTRITDEVVRIVRKTSALFARDTADEAIEAAVVERFLFTAIACIVDNGTAVIAACGDGVVIVDDDVTILEPPLVNAPPYLGYLLLTKTAYHAEDLRQHLGFTVITTVALADLAKGIVIGTDGLKDLIGEDLHHPALVQPKALQRWLNAQTMERIANGAFVPGRCSDDVTLAIVRTDAAQEKLLESKREVTELKQHIVRLTTSVTEVTEQWHWTRRAREEAEERVRALETSLAAIEEQTRHVRELGSAKRELERDIAALRKIIAKSSGPILQKLDRFAAKLGSASYESDTYSSPHNGTGTSNLSRLHTRRSP